MFSDLLNKKIYKSIAGILMTAMLFSCSKNIDQVKRLYQENESIPISETKDFKLTYTLEGNSVLKLSAPIMIDYSNQKKFSYQYFPENIKIEVINNDHKKTVITARKALLYKNPDMAELVGDVKITGSDNSSLETGHLFWDATHQHIFGDEKTVLKQNDEKITGIGFDSSLDFKNVRLNKITGVLRVENPK